MQRSTSAKPPRSYGRPALNKLTPEKAEEFLLHHANLGDPGAREILDLVRPIEASKQLEGTTEERVGATSD